MPTINVESSHGGVIFSTVTTTGTGTDAEFHTARGQNLLIKGNPQPSMSVDPSDAEDTIRCIRQGFSQPFQFRLARCYYEFDTSSITSGVASATLDIDVNATPFGSIILIKGTDLGSSFNQFTDYLSPVGIDNTNSDQSYDGVATKYSDETTLSGTGAQSITFNISALQDMQSDNEFYVCVMAMHDYEADKPTSIFDGDVLRWDGRTGTTPPVLNYTLSTGYGDNVNLVAAANIAKVNGVATANIEKINGVD